jgi:hypothetical protein
MTSADDFPRLFSVPQAPPEADSETFELPGVEPAELRKLDAEAVIRLANLQPEVWLAALLRVYTNKQIAYRLCQNPDIADALWEIIIKEK